MANNIVDVKTFGQGIIKAEKLNLDTQKPDAKKATTKIKLKPGQQEVAKFYDLLKYRDEYFDKDISGGNTWLQQILYEIIDLQCQSDSDIILNHKCPTFQNYLLHLTLMNMRYPQSSKKPFYIPDPALNRVGDKRTTADEDEDDDSDYIHVKITIQIPLSKFIESNTLLDIYRKLHTKMKVLMAQLYSGYDEPTKQLIQLQLDSRYKLNIMMAQLTAT